MGYTNIPLPVPHPPIITNEVPILSTGFYIRYANQFNIYSYKTLSLFAIISFICVRYG